MKTSIFSTSLTLLKLREAVHVAADAGYDAMEVGCFAPHLTLGMARDHGDEICTWFEDADMSVSALSLDVSYTDGDKRSWNANVDESLEFIRLCGAFGTDVAKIMPGRPGNVHATEEHWARFQRAMDTIVPVAEAAGVRLALETHLNHLSDSIDSAARCMESGPREVLGINLDFCNIRTCGEDPLDALELFGDRLYLTHIKDSLFDLPSGRYVPMGTGRMKYGPIIAGLRELGYEGSLSVECLYPWAKKNDPGAAIAHDLDVLQQLLEEGTTR